MSVALTRRFASSVRSGGGWLDATVRPSVLPSPPFKIQTVQCFNVFAIDLGQTRRERTKEKSVFFPPPSLGSPLDHLALYPIVSDSGEITSPR